MATQKIESEAPLEQQLQRAQDVPSSTEATATSTFECQPKLLLVRPPRPFRFCEECNLNRYFEDSDYEREAELARTRPWGTRPPSETSWARLSEATDLLSTIFRFLQLRELMAISRCGSHACLQASRKDGMWKEIALRMWATLMDATLGEGTQDEASKLGVSHHEASIGSALSPSLLSYKDVVRTMAYSWPTEFDPISIDLSGLHK
ncbi:hypothetical protein VYU27_007460, partial [Nannochloropsis oceanica]